MQASLTVEASLIITMTVVVMGIILSLWLHKFQECWYTQAASECLLLGSNKAVLKEDYTNEIDLKWKSVIDENYLIPQNFTSKIDGNKKQIRIKFEGETLMFGFPSLKIAVEQEIEVVKPVAYIRKRAAIQEVIEK